MDNKTIMNEKDAAIEFIKEHGLSGYSFGDFIKLLNKSGFAVEDFRSERAEKFYSLLDTEPHDGDNFFLCNKNGVKVVFINNEASEDVKCHRIAVLFYLLSAEDSRYCTDDEFVSANRFAVYLKDVLSAGLSISDKYSFLNKYGKTVLTAILSILVIIMGLFINNAADKSQNPLENGIYISNDSNNDISAGENLSVSAFAESAVKNDTVLEQSVIAIVDSDSVESDSSGDPSKTVSDTVVDDNFSVPQTEVVFDDTEPKSNVAHDKVISVYDSSAAEVESDNQLQNEKSDSDIAEEVDIQLPNDQDTVSKQENENSTDSEPGNLSKNDLETEYAIDYDEVYYVTKSGKKYHLQSCSYIKDLSQCTAIPKNQIPGSSFEPCKRCIK